MHGLAGRSAPHGPCSMLARRTASRLMHGIGQLGAYDAVGIGGGTELVFRLQDDQDVGVRKRPLLVLDGIEDSSHPAQRSGQRRARSFWRKTPQVRSALHSLPGSKAVGELLPAWVAVNVMNRSSGPCLATTSMSYWRACTARGLPVNDAASTTCLPTGRAAHEVC